MIFRGFGFKAFVLGILVGLVNGCALHGIERKAELDKALYYGAKYAVYTILKTEPEIERDMTRAAELVEAYVNDKDAWISAEINQLHPGARDLVIQSISTVLDDLGLEGTDALGIMQNRAKIQYDLKSLLRGINEGLDLFRKSRLRHNGRGTNGTGTPT